MAAPPCHMQVPTSPTHGTGSVSQQPRSRFEGMAGEGPALSTEAGPKAGQKNLLETVKLLQLFPLCADVGNTTGNG